MENSGEKVIKGGGNILPGAAGRGAIGIFHLLFFIFFIPFRMEMRRLLRGESARNDALPAFSHNRRPWEREHAVACRTAIAICHLLFVIFFSSSAFSQSFNYPVEPVTGLSHNTVTSISQDHRGFIWIGTIDGLNRYDGYECKVFKHDPSDPRSISSSFIHEIYEDRSGTLWISTRDGGLNRFDYATETFRSYRHDPADLSSIGDIKVGGLLEDSRGNFWVTTDGGLCLLDRATGKFTRYVHDPADSSSLSNNEMTGICEDRDGTFWLSTDHGLNKFDPRTGKFKHYFNNQSDPHSLSDNKLIRVLLTRNGTLWVGTRTAGINRLDNATGSFTRFEPDAHDLYKPSSGYAAPLFEDEKGNIWLGTHNGINVYEPATGIFHRIPDGPNAPSFSNPNISYLFPDRAGDVWVATWGGGAYRLARRMQKFSPVSTKTTPAGTIPNDFILSMVTDRTNALWVGTGGGLSRIDRGNSFSIMAVSKVQHPILKTVVWSLMEDADSSIWAGTDNDGIEVFRPTGEKVKHFLPSTEDRYALPDPAIRALFRDSRGTIWAGTQKHGVCSYDLHTKQWLRYPHGVNDESGIGDDLAWAINEDHNGNLWFGTYTGGLITFDPVTKKFKHYLHDPNDTASVGSNDVRSICVTASGDIWVGTYGGGICKAIVGTGKFQRVTERDGLANNFVYGILVDSTGTFWISTNKGLSRYNPAAQSFRNYTSRDGLQSDEFNTGAFYKSPHGELFFGGVGGFNHFFPADIKDNETGPPVVLTSFKVFGKERSFDSSLTAIDTIILRYNENFFSFEFAALDFVDPVRNAYAYKLEGSETDWNYSGTRRYASYSNIDPGEYVIRIKASNSDGVWNEEGLQVHLTVVPPFWMTWWFRSISGLAVAGVFAGAIRYISTRKLKQQVQDLERQRVLQEERERISRDLHDNVGSQLSTIIAGLELAGKRRDPATESGNLLDSLKDDARLTMSQLRETIWAMGTASMSLEEFFETVEAYAKRQVQHRGEPQLHFACTGERGTTLSPIQVLHLFRIAQEALNNALKHAGAKNIHISLAQSGGMLTLSIRDDGTAEKAGDKTEGEENLSGRGMANMERRVREMHGSLKIIRNEGTAVEAVIPSGKKYLN